MQIALRYLGVIAVICLVGCASEKVSPKVWNELIRQGDESAVRKDWPGADKQYAAAVQEAEKFGPESERLSISLAKLAEARFVQGKYSETESICRRQISIDEKRFSTNEIVLADELVKLAEVNRLLKKYDQSEELYRRAQQIVQVNRGASSPLIGIYLCKRASLCVLLNRLEEAEIYYTRGLNFIEDSAFNLSFSEDGSSGRKFLLTESVRVRMEFAALCERLDKLPDAEGVLQRAIMTQENLADKESRTLVPILNALAKIQLNRGELSEADETAQRSLDLIEKTPATKDTLAKETQDLVVSINARRNK